MTAQNAVVEQNSIKGGKGGQGRVALDPETVQLFNEHRKRQIEERLLMGSGWVEGNYVFTEESREPLHIVADRLGHKDPMVTATVYAHISSEQKETASLTFANASKKSVNA